MWLVKNTLFARFLTISGELGSADTIRDPHSFVLNFYTEEGNWDMVGVKKLKPEKAEELVGKEPDYSTKNLYSVIEKGDYTVWEPKIQVIEPKGIKSDHRNVFDVTKVVLYYDLSLIPVDKMVLNRNPENFFVEVERATFSARNMIPSITSSSDYMLQSHLFSYPDTHRNRFGSNYHQLPIN
ncbi:unnamed protein product [Cunninghamella echinulata]